MNKPNYKFEKRYEEYLINNTIWYRIKLEFRVIFIKLKRLMKR